MIAEYLKSLDGVVLLGILSLCLSIAVFAAVIWRAWRLSPASIHILERLPLDCEVSTTGQSDEVTP
ncbi:MAG: hypothetical protein IT282_09985 [Bacteroidetes bacterium]|nr:hypothetical protein [Bacteroidota bacterium]